jgi:DNA-binding LacI/PurR family transcriptional regulator
VPERRAALRQVLTTTLTENPALTAMCAIDDETALALLAALADLSIPVPDRMAVIGNGNLSLASRTVPALTTVSADDPSAYLEQLLANILAASRGEALREPDPLSYHVVVRKST